MSTSGSSSGAGNELEEKKRHLKELEREVKELEKQKKKERKGKSREERTEQQREDEETIKDITEQLSNAKKAAIQAKSTDTRTAALAEADSLKAVLLLLGSTELRSDDDKTEHLDMTIPKQVPEKKVDVRSSPSEYLAWFQDVETILSRSREPMILPTALRTKLVGPAAPIAREAISDFDEGTDLKKSVLRGVYGECWE